MRILQSFWSLPLKKNKRANSVNKPYGFNSKVDYYMSIALSTLLLSEHYDDLSLVSDDDGVRLLVEILELPFKEFNTSLNCLNNYNPSLWAFGKLIAYKQQTSPFIHVDFDFYINNRFPDRIENARNVCYIDEKFESFLENTYYPIREKLIRLGIPNYYKLMLEDMHPYNAGIFGGNDLEIFQELYLNALGFINQCPHIFNSDINCHSSFNIMLEQIIFGFLCKQNNIEPQCLLNLNTHRLVRNSHLNYLRDENYIHTMGELKRTTKNQIYVHSIMFERFPYYYELIQKKVYEGIL